ncbi:MAG: alanine racemase [Pseudomonadota bacterium]
MTSDNTIPQLHVDLAAIGRNLETIRVNARGAEVAPVVKANAYGLGACQITNYLSKNHGVRSVFVATAQEATALERKQTHPLTIYTLSGFNGDHTNARTVRDASPFIQPVIGSPSEAKAWTTAGGGQCAIAIDIGMNRTGLSLKSALSLCNEGGLNAADVGLVVMHLSHSGTPADPANQHQVLRFEEVRDALACALPHAKFSLSASGGIDLQHEAQEALVRPGIALWGGAADGIPGHGYETVATLSAPVVMTRHVPVGETISYQGLWRARRPSKIAVLGIGYADGYLRSLSNKGEVLIGGARCPVVGAVTMDLTMVDITDCPTRVEAGEIGEIFGRQINIDWLAGQANTIAYELLTAVGPRVERLYVAF